MKYDDSMMLDQLPPAWKNKKEEKIKKSQHPLKNRKITMLTNSKYRYSLTTLGQNGTTDNSNDNISSTSNVDINKIQLNSHNKFNICSFIIYLDITLLKAAWLKVTFPLC